MPLFDKLLTPEQAAQNIVNQYKKAYPSNIFRAEVSEVENEQHCTVKVFVFDQFTFEHKCWLGLDRKEDHDYIHSDNMQRMLRHLVII